MNSAGEGPGLEEGSPRGWGHRSFLQAASGAEPQDEVGGPQDSPRADFSLWTLRLLASGRSYEL